MKNPLLSSAVIVFGFWWAVFSIWSVGSLHAISLDVLAISAKKLVLVASCVLGGALSTVIFLILSRKLRLEQLTGTAARGLQISIGPVPRGLAPPARIENSVFEPDKGHPLEAWLTRLRAERKDILAVFQALVDIYAAHLHVPAAPVSYGHGGRSLFEHTLVVVDMIMERAQTYSFDGSHSKSGRKTSVLLDPQYVFDRDDPLIPLLGFAHDIGKISVYRVEENGKVTELESEHDRPGRLLLARLDEVWDLPIEDRSALFNAVGYYHHPQALPKHVDDRSRALMELLLESDLAAGEWEGQHPLHRSSPLTPGVESKARVAELEVVPILDGDVSRDSSPSPSEFGEGQLDEHEAILLHHLRDVMARPSAINGSRKEFRIGYKYGSLVYLKEALLCKAVAEALGEPKLATPAARKGDNRSQLTEDVMLTLSKMGLLLEEHDGRTYSYKTALFTVEWYDSRAFLPEPPKAVAQLMLERDPACVVVRTDGPFAHLRKLADCRLVPRIVRPLMGEHKAKNKRKGAAEKPEEASADGAPSRVDDDDGLPPIDFRMDSDAGPLLDTREVDGEVDPPVSFECENSACAEIAKSPVPEDGRKKGQVRGLKSGSRSKSFVGDLPDEPEDLLAGVLSLCAAAEEKASAKARQEKPGAVVPPEPLDPPESSVGAQTLPNAGTAPPGPADALGDVVSVMNDEQVTIAPGKILAAVAKLGIASSRTQNSAGVTFQTSLLSAEMLSELGPLVEGIKRDPSCGVRIVTDRNTGQEYIAVPVAADIEQEAVGAGQSSS